MTEATVARRQRLKWASTSPAADMQLDRYAAPPPPTGAGGKEGEEDHTFTNPLLYHRKALPLTPSPNPIKFSSISSPHPLDRLPVTALGSSFLLTILPSSELINPRTHLRLTALRTCWKLFLDPAWSSLHVGSEMPCLLLCMVTHSYF